VKGELKYTLSSSVLFYTFEVDFLVSIVGSIMGAAKQNDFSGGGHLS